MKPLALWGRRFRLPIFAALLSLTLAAAPDPVAWKLELAPGASVKPGATFSVKLIAKIQPGWHMYSMKPVEDGPIPTRVWVPEGQPFQQAGSIKADEPETMQDPTLHVEVELYEGGATFVVPVKVAAGTAAGARTLIVSTSYQTCDNSLCLPPKTVKVELPVTIAK